MRKAIYQYLTANCKTIPRWSQPYMDAPPKPYGVIVLGEQLPAVGNTRGAYRSLYIWPYVDGESFLVLDDAVKEITKLLSGVTLATDAGNRFSVEWVNEGRDFFDNDLKALTRRVEFRIPILAPRQAPQGA